MLNLISIGKIKCFINCILNFAQTVSKTQADSFPYIELKQKSRDKLLYAEEYRTEYQ